MRAIARRMAAGGMCLALAASCATAQSRVVIDRGQPAQTVSGWEVTLRFWEFDKANDRYDPSWLDRRDTIIEKLVNDAGVTRVRLQLRSGVENPVDYWAQFVDGKIGYRELMRRFYYEKINDNADPAISDSNGFQWSSFDYYVENFVIPFRNSLAARNQPLFVNLCYVDFPRPETKSLLSHADAPDEYAELIVMAAKRLRDRFGLQIDALELILEPDNTARWSGAAIGRAALAAKAKLAASGLRPQIITPSTASASRAAAFLDGIAAVPGAAGAIDVVSYHRYDGALADLALNQIRQRARALGAETAMLEYVHGAVRNYFKDIEAGGASAWAAYGVAAAATPGGLAKPGYVLWRNPAGVLTLTPQFTQIALLQREIRPGARVYAARAQGINMAMDFQNPDGSEVIAVYSPDGGPFEIVGAAQADFTAMFAGRADSDYTTTNVSADGTGAVNLKVPAGSVAVLRSRKNSSP